MKNKHFYFFVGTTAEFIKLAPVIREFKRRKVSFKIIASGQNLIDFSELKSFIGDVTADINFPRKKIKSSIFGFFIWTFKTFLFALSVFKVQIRPDKGTDKYLIIHGDTVSSLVGAVAGKLRDLKIVQVESGLRSFKLFEPLPEELIRRIISKLADIHFAPNDWSMKNLSNAHGEKVDTIQNTLIESCLWAISKGADNEYVKSLKNYYVLFIHRQEHIYFNQEWTRNIIRTVVEGAPKKLTCVLVMHALTSRVLNSEGIDELSRLRHNFVTLPKLPYVDFINLVNKAEFIATDSCTSQEEASYLGVPYLGLRNLTERVEGLGENVVISKGDMHTISHFLRNYETFKRRKINVNKLPSKIVVDYLLSS